MDKSYSRKIEILTKLKNRYYRKSKFEAAIRIENIIISMFNSRTDFWKGTLQAEVQTKMTRKQKLSTKKAEIIIALERAILENPDKADFYGGLLTFTQKY